MSKALFTLLTQLLNKAASAAKGGDVYPKKPAFALRIAGYSGTCSGVALIFVNPITFVSFCR